MFQFTKLLPATVLALLSQGALSVPRTRSCDDRYVRITFPPHLHFTFNVSLTIRAAGPPPLPPRRVLLPPRPDTGWAPEAGVLHE
ncbi:hypothetical protein C8R44DRAFT_889433 [Mycena epipterygia]|nr:hypothetical protein C8R44DRAFT_889433 [Mycena epipterygia]